MASPFDADKFRERLTLMPVDDPIIPLLLSWFDACVHTELGPATAHGLDDAEAHRFRGRIGMCLDLRNDLERTWREIKEKK